MSSESTDEDKVEAVFGFVYEYGLLGLMTSLPTTSKFMDYEKVYLIKNQFIKEEVMSTEEYLQIFFPFDMPDIARNGINTRWDISGDRDMMVLALTMLDRPMAVSMEFQRNYAERYDWLVKQFKDWAFIFFTSMLCYTDYDKLGEEEKNVYRQSMACFDGISPSYHIELLEALHLYGIFNHFCLQYK